MTKRVRVPTKEELKEIFFKALKQAEDRGCKIHLEMLPVMPISPTSADVLAKQIWWQRRHEILFSHNFLRTFWGGFYSWKHSAQEMVLFEEPIVYLREFIDV